MTFEGLPIVVALGDRGSLLQDENAGWLLQISAWYTEPAVFGWLGLTCYWRSQPLWPLDHFVE